jgi:L-seryl-tRNA(Ser) seleniumtransferase
MSGSRPDDERSRLRALPPVDQVLAALGDAPHHIAVEAARRAVGLARQEARGGTTPAFEEVVARAQELLSSYKRSVLQPVLNATGVLVHTNLGRVPLSRGQLAAVAEIAGGYSNLEYDLEAGGRGSRYDHARRVLTALTGAEACLVVNNNAAALLLVLSGLCAGREVVISRGELIEIGGEFRLPEVMETSGAHLVEVGTTNRTRLEDYERAIGDNTSAILKVHPSNYRIVGFTSSVPTRELARLARGRGVPFLYDVGSGLVAGPARLPLSSTEPPVDAAVVEGADIVTFSGDKLLGGPQAGVIVGRTELIARLSRHPLLRALRVDKMALAALESTASAYLEGEERRLPLWEMALAATVEVERRARSLARRLDDALGTEGLKAEVVPSHAVMGGGSLPGHTLASWAVALSHSELADDEVDRRLRFTTPPVIARIEDDRVLLDLRSSLPQHDDALSRAVTAALA